MDETLVFNGEFYFMVSLTFNFMTHKELVIVPKEFHPYKTSLFLKMLPHQKCLCGGLLNANEIMIKLSLRLTL